MKADRTHALAGGLSVLEVEDSVALCDTGLETVKEKSNLNKS